jgi:hypothetical protein
LGIFPFHRFVFPGMLGGLIAEAETADTGTPTTAAGRR